MRASLSLLLCLGALVIGQVFSQDACERLTEEDLGRTDVLAQEGIVAKAITPGGDPSMVGVTARVVSFRILCEAQAKMKDRYRYTSALFTYVCDSSDPRLPNCDGETMFTAQLTLGCVSGIWSLTVFNTQDFALTSSPIANESTPLSSNCFLCIHPDNMVAESYTVSSDTHCVECSNCAVGLERCYGNNDNSLEEICCNYFDPSSCCVESCPAPTVPGTDFQCGCTTLFDDNGEFSYTNNQAIDSEATLTCNSGYEVNNSPATCMAEGWSVMPTCTPLCPLLLLIVNGQDVMYDNQILRAGTVATYSCNPGFLVEPENGDMRTCGTDGTWSGTSPVCKSCSEDLSNCKECKYENGEKVCIECQDGFSLDDNECKPTTTTTNAASSCDIACIIGIVLAILAVIVITTVVIVVAFVLYKYLNDPATKLAKTDAEGLNGVARDNPLYLDPSAVTDDAVDGLENGAMETTPLDS